MFSEQCICGQEERLTNKMVDKKLTNKKERDRLYYFKNKKEILEKNKVWREQNKEQLKISAHNKYLENKEEILEKNKEWPKLNKERYLKNDREYRKRVRKERIDIRLIESVRTRTGKAFKSKKINKNNHTLELLGCSQQYYKKYITDKLKPGMTTDNYGLWHIDHIIPLSSFDLTKKDEQLKAFHYQNTQPLWAKENLSKGAKI